MDLCLRLVLLNQSNDAARDPRSCGASGRYGSQNTLFFSGSLDNHTAASAVTIGGGSDSHSTRTHLCGESGIFRNRGTDRAAEHCCIHRSANADRAQRDCDGSSYHINIVIQRTDHTDGVPGRNHAAGSNLGRNGGFGHHYGDGSLEGVIRRTACRKADNDIEIVAVRLNQYAAQFGSHIIVFAQFRSRAAFENVHQHRCANRCGSSTDAQCTGDLNQLAERFGVNIDVDFGLYRDVVTCSDKAPGVRDQDPHHTCKGQRAVG